MLLPYHISYKCEHKMKKLYYLAITLAATISSANAVTYPDIPGACYIFQNDKVLSKGVCLISASNGYGLIHRDLSFNGKTYSLFEDGNSRKGLYKLNDHIAQSYSRDARFLSVIKTSDSTNKDLICYKSKTTNICYRGFHDLEF